MPYVLSLLIVAFFTGCATSTLNTSQQLDKVVIINHSKSHIENASIYAKLTQRKMQCGFIPKQGHCQYKFTRQSNKKNSFKIVWTTNNITYTHDDITFSSLKLKKGDPVSISINLLNDGNYVIHQH